MIILFVNEIPMNPLYGGIERVTDLLARELNARVEYSVLYLCARTDGEEMLNYNFPAKQFVLPYEGGFDNKDNLLWYKHFLLDNRVDIVVNQRGWAPFMNDALNVCGLPTISVIHSMPWGAHVMYMKEILRYNKTLNGVWRYCCKLIIYPIYYLYKYIKSFRSQTEHYKALVTNSSAVVLLSRKCVLEFYDIVKSFQGCKVCSISNPNTYEVALDKTITKEKIVLYVGRLCENQKRPIRMLRIWEKMYKRYPEWRMIFIGEGDALNEMKEYADQHNIRNVEFLGQLSNVNEYYEKSDFICLTSDFEGWGMTLTEGMSYGCIPFTFDNYGAASEIIDDHINGCLISPFNLDEYAERLSIIMDDDIMRARMSSAAREKVKQFSVDKITDKWIDLFASISR